MGPDEYHAPVDDDAYTNLMVRWNLRCATRWSGGATPESARWRDLALRLVDGYDPISGRHEQFVGYSQLEPLLAADIGAPPLAADLLLGHERVARTQLIKQAAVLMAHHLIGDELPVGSLDADLDHYLPRTAHGSSLSPGIHASLLARAGRPDAALELFRLAARLDLDDLTGTTAGGVHTACAGSVWQALVWGFLGVRPRGGVLVIDPHLPDAWEAVEVRLRLRGTRFRVRATHRDVEVTAGRDGTVLIGGARRRVGRTPRRLRYREVGT
jgi:trehalose/maltose hydrolase-like predicted phosphorylase